MAKVGVQTAGSNALWWQYCQRLAFKMLAAVLFGSNLGKGWRMRPGRGLEILPPVQIKHVLSPTQRRGNEKREPGAPKGRVEPGARLLPRSLARSLARSLLARART